MVPETLAGKGTRSADLGVHGKRAARRAAGLEGALVDRDPMTIIALDHTDERTVVMNVAGPAALIVAKLHKLWERTQNDDRVKDKDALDVFRLLQSTPTIQLASRLAMLGDSLSAGPPTTDAISYLAELFGTTTGRGVQLAVRATANLVDEEELRLSLVALTEDLLRVYDQSRLLPRTARRVDGTLTTGSGRN